MNATYYLKIAQEKRTQKVINLFFKVCIDRFSDQWHTLAASFFQYDYKEVVQDFLVRKFIRVENLDKYPRSSDNDLLKYSCTMLKHHCIDKYTAENRNRERINSKYSQDTARLSSPEDRLVLGMDIENALSGIKEKDQRIALGLYLSGLSYKEVAEKMNKTENAVRNLIYRARKYLRQKML